MYFPKSEREARALSNRKIRSIENRAHKLLLEVATYWDEGQVTGQIDLTLANLNRDLTAIRECMDEEIRAHEEEAEL